MGDQPAFQKDELHPNVLYKPAVVRYSGLLKVMDEQLENELLVRGQQVERLAPNKDGTGYVRAGQAVFDQDTIAIWNYLKPENDYAVIEVDEKFAPKVKENGKIGVLMINGLLLRQAVLYSTALKYSFDDPALKEIVERAKQNPAPAVAYTEGGATVIDDVMMKKIVSGLGHAVKYKEELPPVRRAAGVATSTAIDPVKEPLASALKEQGLWPEEQLKVFESIDPSKRYKLFKMDENGKIMHGPDGKPIEGAIDGQKLRDAHALLKAWGNRKNLSEQSKAALYKQMGLETDGSHFTDEQFTRAMSIIGEASKEVGGNAAAVRALKDKDTPNTGAVFDQNMAELARLAQVAKGISPAQVVEGGEAGELLAQFRDFQKRQEEAKGMARPKQVASL